MDQSDALSPLELWGGIEPTINRVGDTYFNQDTRSRHSERLDDLDRFASLGIRAIRYPILWEATMPDGPASADWRFADERLPRLRELGIRPIVGLLHHGSGPRHTSLVDPAFPDKLADYARAVAERFPWVDTYTPVNEPLTTARFSGLYGFWYPHGADDRTFVRALVTQCQGIRRAMCAIRGVNPDACLLQTEDLGVTVGTTGMAAQVDFANARRWLGHDLLFGRVDRDHALWAYLQHNGIDECDLQEFLEQPCPPDLLGLDYYARSERFLDERVERYPAEQPSDDGGTCHVDIDVVRVAVEGMGGPGPLLAAVWERYQRPLAVTETHLGSFRDEQLRWMWETWGAAQTARSQGVDVRAVTMWSLLGTYNWTSILTVDDGQYEPGVFDLRAPTPRPTALCRLTQDLATGRTPELPALDGPGWWKRWERLTFQPFRVTTGADYTGAPLGPDTGPTGRPLLITGGGSALAHCLIRLCQLRGLAWRSLLHTEMDVTNSAAVDAALTMFRPWAVVNAAGLADPDLAEDDPERACAVLADGPATLAAACAQHKIPLVTFSSDQVFDGMKGDKYVESDPVAPLSVYGRRQAEGEQRALDTWDGTLVIRNGAHFDPFEARNVLTRALTALASGQPFAVADDCVVTPIYVMDLCNDTLDLLIDGERGIWHIAHPQAVTWLDFVRCAARITGVDAGTLEGRPLHALGLKAQRPRYSALGSERGVLPPPLEQALGRYCADCQVGWVTMVSEEERCREAPVPTRIR